MYKNKTYEHAQQANMLNRLSRRCFRLDKML